MSWDFTADDLRRELKELKEKLAVQGVKVGEQETRLLKNEEELKITRANYVDTLNKLQREADRRVELEEALKRRSDELCDERNTRKNVEETLRLAREEREREAASARDAQYYLNRVAVESNDYRAQQERLAAEKAKLEAQVRELQGELQRQRIAPPPPLKTPARPRSSSLTNLNKVAMLERDIEQIRALASTSQVDLKSAQDKLSKVQSDLVRTENEKSGLEKRLLAQEQKMRDLLSDKEDLQVELQFYREQDGSSREDELLARIEEEEAKVALLEKQLSQSCGSSASKRFAEQLQARLNNEVSRREDLEAREIQLVQEREEAFNELDDLKGTAEQLKLSVAQKDLNIGEVESRCRTLQQQLDQAQRAASHSMGIDEDKIKDMVNCIARVRAERDELRAHLEFVQTEAHFKVQSLEKELAGLATDALDPAQQQEYQLTFVRLNDELVDRKRGYHRLQTALQAMAVTVQHLPVLDLAGKMDEVNRLVVGHHAVLVAKDEELTEFKLRLSDTSTALRKEEDVRSALERQVQKLEVDLNTAKQELADTSEHCERLEARLSSAASHDNITRSLKSEIEELRNRVMRRTEQIGLQQHDIKRLETNMRLTEERLEEALGELEMAETAKAAMIEDCSNAREERDEAKKALIRAELEVEQLSSQIQQRVREAGELRAALTVMEENGLKAYVSKANETSTMIEAIAERDGRIRILTERLEESATSLRRADERATVLEKNIEELQQASNRSADELQKQMQSKEYAASEELERRARELEVAAKELDSSRLALTEARNELEAKNTQYQSACDEMNALAAELDAMKAKTVPYDEKVAHQKTKEALHVKEEDLHRLMAELDAVKASREESARLLGSKEEELATNSAELERLLSEIDANNKEHAAAFEAKEAQLSEMNEKVERLGREKTDLQARLSAFEAETDKELAVATSLRSSVEEERKRFDHQIKQLEADLASLRTDKDDQERASEAIRRDLSARCEETLALLEATRQELKEKQALCDSLAHEQRKAADCREDEVVDLGKRLADVTSELESLRKSLQEEIDRRNREATAHQEELQVALERQESLSVIESELRGTIEKYQQQLEDVRTNLMTLQDENTTLQSDFDKLSGECTRATQKGQALERQLASSERELSKVQDEMSRVREALSKSERSGKAAEMNLLLISQQHERTISSLRSQLKEREKDSERIQKLQQIVGETKEQISEMEGLLKDKCAEIEENDDKFIQLLKEKKKLMNKVESLTKKNNALQKKLSAVRAEAPVVASAPAENPARRQSTAIEPAPSTSKATIPPAPAPVPAPAPAPVPPPTVSLPPVKLEPIESKRTLRSPPAEAPRETRRVSGSKRRRESSPPPNEIPTSTSIGKKRPLPDDSDSGCAPVEARLPDAFRPGASSSSVLPAAKLDFEAPLQPFSSELTSTPRRRRAAPHSGFTPVRGQSTNIRALLSQPSPVKRSAASRALQASKVISDITNSPPRSKRLFTAEPGSSEPRAEKPAGKGWLGKIRGSANRS